MEPIEVLVGDASLILADQWQVEKLAEDFFAALDTLETIASFSPGRAGDEAAKTLMKLGVWKDGLVNMETGEVLHADTTDTTGAESQRAGDRAEALPEHHELARRASRPRPRRS
jgi:hypothetical protein